MKILYCLLPLVVYGQIISSVDFTSLQDNVIDQDMLVIMDIDNTLIKAKSYLGSVEWGEALIEELIEKGTCPMIAQEIQNHLWKIVQPKIEITLVDPITTEIVENLTKRNIPLLALTARSYEERAYTPQQLAGAGISIDTSNYMSEDKIVPSFDQGILYASTLREKADVLFEFLEAISFYPKHVLFIDDKKPHLEKMQKECHKKGINFTGIHFTRAEQAIYNNNLATLQWEHFPQILTNDEARILYEQQ